MSLGHFPIIKERVFCGFSGSLVANVLSLVCREIFLFFECFLGSFLFTPCKDILYFGSLMLSVLRLVQSYSTAVQATFPGWSQLLVYATHS